VIISGEHSVVYGYPAIVIAVNLGVKANVIPLPERSIRISSDKYGVHVFRLPVSNESNPLYPMAKVAESILEDADSRNGLSISIKSEIPPGAGMGSSASASVAVAYATMEALHMPIQREKLIDYAMVGEKIIHKNPSGVDVYIAVDGGVIWYTRSEGSKKLDLSYSFPIILVDTGIERNTGLMVSKVADFRRRNPELFNICMGAIGRITQELREIIIKGSFVSKEAGLYLLLNHLLLSILGVSSKELDEIVYRSMREGALGAKLTGAGGGGAALVLPPEDKLKVVNSLRRKYNVYSLSLSISGVKSCQEV